MFDTYSPVGGKEWKRTGDEIHGYGNVFPRRGDVECVFFFSFSSNNSSSFSVEAAKQETQRGHMRPRHL